MRPDLTITTESVDGVTIVGLIGEQDLNTAPDLKEALTHAAAAEGSRVVVDLTETTFIDSSGVQALLQAVRTAEQRDRSFVVVLPADSALRRVFDVLGLYEVLTVVETRDAATGLLGAV